MRYHPLARTTVHTRKQMAEAVLSGRLGLNEAAAEFKLSRQSAASLSRGETRKVAAGHATMHYRYPECIAAAVQDVLHLTQ